jgi:branched-chain amino acid transport system ATP-binding protein
VEQSTHRALEHADRIYVLRNGEIQLQGVSSKLDDGQLEQAYFGFDSSAKATAHF